MTAGYKILNGDALAVLKTLKPASVQTCVTSPPYWGLRDYGTAKWKGGLAACDHVRARNLKRDTSGGMLPAGEGTRGTQSSTASSVIQFGDVCGKCGARRVDAQLGIESTPEAYVASLVEVFREVRRVLKDNGTCWINLGDSYATGGGKVGNCPGGGKQGERYRKSGPKTQPNRMPMAGLKPKDLVGIPWMVAFALRADGWYLRSDIIWHKPNPMPESIRDRPTKSHEYLFLLSKSQRYFYDHEAVKEPGVYPAGVTVTGSLAHFGRREKLVSCQAHRGSNTPITTGFRNRRTVWTLSTKPFKGAHFATFPPKLVEPCILAGSRAGDLVLDPFSGAGTSGLVAVEHGRRYVGIELNPEYCEMSRQRIDGSIGKRATLKAAA